jgi:uncharacterized protein YjbJ (UPF0337 family)
MNKEQLQGAVSTAVGKTKEAVGQLLGVETLAMEGKVDQARGAARSALGNAKNAAGEAMKRYHRYIDF